MDRGNEFVSPDLSEGLSGKKPGRDLVVASRAALVGNSLSFSDQMLRILGAEFPDVEFQRYGDPEHLFDDDRPGHRLIVVDHAVAQDPVGLVRALRDRFPEAMVALAYRSLRAAPELCNRSILDALGPPVSLVPLNVSLEVWLSLLRLLLCGEDFIASEVVKAWRRRGGEGGGARPAKDGAGVSAGLTRRELQVLPLLAEGKQNKAIADVLGLSEHTVKLHTHNIFVKLKVNNRTCAADWYWANCRPGGTGAPDDRAPGS